MTWLVFGVSCLLVLAGAVSIISGAPIIQLERGWAEVISGTVALSSGGVVFALAGILMRLETIRDTLAARTLPVPAETVPLSPLAASLDTVEPLRPVPAGEAEPVTPPLARPAVSSPTGSDAPLPDAADAPEAPTQALWKKVKRPGSESSDAEGLRQHGFPDRIVPDLPTEPSAGDDLPVMVPAHAVPAPPAATPQVETPPREPAASGRDTGQIGWLERSLFKARPAAAGKDAGVARTEPAVETRPSERAARVEPSLAAIAPPALAPGQMAAAEPEPTPDLSSEQHQGVNVVGRYQAGSASYVMYSDGTIEVETESGEIHRFGSMDELKAFIAQQDSTVS